MEKVNAKFATGRLETLKNGAILDDCENINFDSNYSLYNSMINLFSQGYFDPIFISPSFSDLSTEERRELLKKGREHLDLCFDKGGIANWAEYASNKFFNDFDLCFMNIFKNFDILLKVLRYGKDGSMEFLESFKNNESEFDGSVFDELRLYFDNEDVLIQALIAFGQNSNMYCQYSDDQKRLLCQYAKGVLYSDSDYENGYSLRSPMTVALNIRKVITGDEVNSSFLFEDYGKLIENNDYFVDAVTCLYNNELSYDRKSISL